MGRFRLLSFVTIACLILGVAPAMANIYSNGPIDGQTQAYTINFGFSVSNSFQLSCTIPAGDNECTLFNLSIGVWLVQGDNVGSVTANVGSAAFGFDVMNGQVLVPSTITDLGLNQYGFDIQNIDFLIPFDYDVDNNVTYWLTLFNAVETHVGDPIYWDQNSGVGCTGTGCPSLAFDSALGPIPSETFTISGSTSEPIPEPGTLIMLGTGILGLAATLRRKLF